jgi:hypothetical protein
MIKSCIDSGYCRSVAIEFARLVQARISVNDLRSELIDLFHFLERLLAA